jgi:folate-dependent phosphoribosylglycinamide formyltransferase PurN
MLNVAVLCSKRAPGLEALRERVHVACVLDRQPPRTRDRKDFDAETAAMLRPFDIDAVVLLGYLFIITDPLLSAFPGQIINIHDADLTLRNAGGGPRYPGLHATRDAIIAGERETRSCAHLVTPQLDAGPVIARSEAFPVAPFVHEAVARGENDIVRAYSFAQREWMMRSSWGALAAEALEIWSALRTDKSVCATLVPVSNVLPSNRPNRGVSAASRDQCGTDTPVCAPAAHHDQCGTDTLVCAPAGAAA